MFEHAGQTFIVRIMFEPGRQSSDPHEWRGMVQHVVSGERRFFVGVQQIPELIVQLVRSDPVASAGGCIESAGRPE